MNIFEGLHIKLDLKTYPNRIFFFKEDMFWMDYNWKTKDLWCRGEGFWEVLEREYHWGYDEVERFIKNQVEQHFKLKDVTPYANTLGVTDQVEQYFDI